MEVVGKLESMLTARVSLTMEQIDAQQKAIQTVQRHFLWILHSSDL